MIRLDKGAFLSILRQLPFAEQLKHRDVCRLVKQDVDRRLAGRLKLSGEQLATYRLNPPRYFHRRMESLAAVRLMRQSKHYTEAFWVEAGAKLAALPSRDGEFVLIEGNRVSPVRHGEGRLPPFTAEEVQALGPLDQGLFAETACGETVKGAGIVGRWLVFSASVDQEVSHIRWDHFCTGGIISLPFALAALSIWLAAQIVGVADRWPERIAEHQAIWAGLEEAKISLWESIVDAKLFTATVDRQPWLIESVPTGVVVRNLRADAVVHSFPAEDEPLVALCEVHGVPHVGIASGSHFEVRNLITGEQICERTLPEPITALLGGGDQRGFVMRSDQLYIEDLQTGAQLAFPGQKRPVALLHRGYGLWHIRAEDGTVVMNHRQFSSYLPPGRVAMWRHQWIGPHDTELDILIDRHESQAGACQMLKWVSLGLLGLGGLSVGAAQICALPRIWQIRQDFSAATRYTLQQWNQENSV